MNPDPSDRQEFEYDWLEPAAHETMLLAQSLAMYMHAAQVYPEHFLLAVSMHGDNRAAYLLSNLGITGEKLLSLEIDTSRLGIVPSTRPSFDLTGNVLPLSADLQKCVYQAIAVAKHLMNAPAVAPEHLVLSLLSNQRVQSFLSPLALTVDTILEYLNKYEEIRGTGLLLATFFNHVMLASAHEKLTIPNNRSQSLLHVLKDFEHPTTRFADIPGFDEVKGKLRPLAEFLKASRTSHHFGGKVVMTVLLIGHVGAERKRLVEALAGEAGTPLISLSFSGLVAAFASHDDCIERVESFGPSVRISVQSLPSKRGMDLARSLLREFFLLAKYKSPRLFLIDDLDAIGRVTTTSGREQLLDQLMAEIDFLKDGERSVVIATTSRPQNLSYVLRRPGLFKYMVFMQQDMQEVVDPIKPSKEQSNRCPSCKHSIQPQWHHCPFCGSSLARVCPRCGAPSPEIEGARFCFECGGELGA